MKILRIFILAFLFSGSAFAQDVQKEFFVFLNTNPDKKEIPEDSVTALQKAHLANIGALYKKGLLTAAGPFQNGGGMFILLAPNLDSAQNILKTDPAISADRFRLEVLPLTFLHAKVCEIHDEDAMGAYQTLRLLPKDKKMPVDASSVKKMSKKARLKAAIAFNSGGGIIIFEKGEVSDPEAFENELDPKTLRKLKANFEFEFKQLWTAEETFCND